MSPRLHLVELEDLAWFPPRLRDLMTDALGAVQRDFGVHEAIADVLQALLRETGSHRIVDLCSGAGGLVPRVRKALAQRGQVVDVIFTDRYPNHATLERVCARDPQALQYCSEPVDAADLPAHMRGCRTLFTSFHHFRPAKARAILANAQRAGAPLAIFEITERSWSGLARSVLTPLACWLATPRLRPRTLERLLFTYVLPIVPLALTWDAFVSSLRTYTLDELTELIGQLPGGDYVWRLGQLRGPLGQVTTYLLGVPEPAVVRTPHSRRDHAHVTL